MTIRPRDSNIDDTNSFAANTSTTKNTRPNVRKSTSDGSIASANAQKQQKTLQSSDRVAKHVLSGNPQEIMTIGRHRGIKVADSLSHPQSIQKPTQSLKSQGSHPKEVMTIGRHRGKEVAEKSPEYPVNPNNSPRSDSESQSGNLSATTTTTQKDSPVTGGKQVMPDFSPTSPKLSVKDKIKQSFASIFRPPSPTGAEKGSKPSSPKFDSTPLSGSPTISPRLSKLIELAQSPANSLEEKKELANALEALSPSYAGFAKLCEKVNSGNQDKTEVLNQLLTKLTAMGLTSSSKSDSERAERNAFIGAISKVLGSDTTNELVALAFKNEAAELLQSKSQCDQRWRTTTPAVALYAAVVQSEMPDVTENGNSVQSCMEFIKTIRTDKSINLDTADSTLSSNIEITDKVFSTISAALDHTPDSVKKLNSSLTEVFRGFYAEAKTKYYPDLKVDEQVKQQVSDLLFLRVINPSIGNAAKNINLQHSGVVVSKYLQSAINNDAFNKMNQPGEKELIKKLHTTMKNLVGEKLTVLEKVASEKSTSTSAPHSSLRTKSPRSIPAPPNYAAPLPPTNKQAASQSANARFVEVLNMYANNIKEATTTEELESLKRRLSVFENRTGNEQRKDEIKELRRLLDEKMEIRTRLEDIQKKRHPTSDAGN